MTTVKKEFLGTGWQFPVETDRRGDLELSSGIDDIEESIQIILGTAKGERVMRPEFGCGIHEYVFTSVNATTLTLVETTVEDALVQWEPRIEVLDVDASRDRTEPSKLTISIDYRVRSSNTEHNLVYPFYLTEGSRRE